MTEGLSLTEDVVRRDDFSNLIDDAKSIAIPAASQVVSAAESIATNVATQVKSAVGAAATSLEGTIDRIIPKNLTLGTSEFCIGFSDTIPCKHLPLNLSELVPDAVDDLPYLLQNAIRDEVNNLQPIATSLTNITYFQVCLWIGLAAALIIAVVFVASISSRLFCIGAIIMNWERRTKIKLLSILGFCCCAPLLFAMAALLVLKTKAASLPSWVAVEQGGVVNLCIGAFCGGLFLTVVAVISPCLV